MRPGDPVFLDTNILVYAVDRDSPFYQKAKAIVDQVDAGEMNACISPQVLGELYAVTTTPGRIRRPLSLKAALGIVLSFLQADTLWKIYPKPTTINRTFALVKTYRIAGRRFFDAQIVATMLDNNVGILYTVNEGDFKSFREIEVINPFR